MRVVLVQENVFGLYITVDDIFGVEVLEALDDLVYHLVDQLGV